MERLTLRDDDGRALFTPYGLKIYCSTQATADCILKLEEALKAQEPRVLTPEELQDWQNAIWFEEKGEYPFLALIRSYYKDDELNIIDAHCYGKITKHDMGLYNKWWRCWSSRPTDEQREAVKWDA